MNEYIRPSLAGDKQEGIYVGGVRKMAEGVYNDFFDTDLASMANNSREFQVEQREYQQALREPQAKISR